MKRVAQEKAQAKKAAPASANEGGWGGDFTPARYRPPKTEIRMGGILSEIKEVTTKKGSRMAFAQLEDLHGKIEVIFFPEAYASSQEMIKRAIAEAEPIVVNGEVEFGEEAPKILAKSLEWVVEAQKNRIQQIVIRLSPRETTPDQLRELKKQLLQVRGKCPVRIEFDDVQFRTRLELPGTLRVAASPQAVLSINRIFGKDVVSLQ